MERMFANAFKYFRNKAGLTQVLVARKAGLDQSEISRLEGGYHWPSFKTTRRVCNAIGITEKIFFCYLAHDLLSWPSEVWDAIREDDGSHLQN